MRKYRFAAVAVSVLGVIALTLAIGSSGAGSTSSCRFVNGHLLDEHIAGPVAVGRLVGGINGDYTYTFLGEHPDATFPVNHYVEGDVVVHTSSGDLFWHESSATDRTREDQHNTAVLATLTGGTGEWAGATGHVILFGWFHLSTLTGEFDYRGEVCTS